MPAVFKARYLSTRVIIDATEIYVEQPALPELQQITYSNYKNKNTYKGLIGISPSCAVTFISDLYSGSISDKELTRKYGLLSLLEPGDSEMADRGFDIKEDLDILGVKLNMPPFLRGKQQLNENELIETSHIATLCIHIRKSNGTAKKFNSFDRPLCSSYSQSIFFICASLTSFSPFLCK